MAQLNKVLLIGNLTRDPEVRYTPKGSAVADIGLALNRTWRDKNGDEKEEVCYATCIVWGKQAEAAGKYLKKGSPVFIEGRLKFEQWEKNGEKRSMLKIWVDRLQFLGGVKKQAEESHEEDEILVEPPHNHGDMLDNEPDLAEEDIPF